MPGRHANTADYRYGFQGQEMDDEIKGEGNSVNYTFRMHDPRVGRFFATDPLESKYPWYTPYQFSGNKTISAIELEGLEELQLNTGISDDRKVRAYRVQEGDNLTEISRNTGVGIEELITYNDLHDRPDLIHTGETLYLEDRSFIGLNPVTGEYFDRSTPFYNTEEYQSIKNEQVNYKLVIMGTNIVLYMGGTILSGQSPGSQRNDYNSTRNTRGEYKNRLSNRITNETNTQINSIEDNLALGFEKQARSLAKDINGRHLMDTKNWKSAFQDALNNRNTKFHFSLDDMDGPLMKELNNPSRSSTNWELNQIFQNKEAFERTTFYRNGQSYQSSDVFSIKF